jgi:hypothetical protein
MGGQWDGGKKCCEGTAAGKQSSFLRPNHRDSSRPSKHHPSAALDLRGRRDPASRRSTPRSHGVRIVVDHGARVTGCIVTS